MSVISGTNYSATTIASLEPLLTKIYSKNEITGDVGEKVFLGDQLRMTGAEVSYGVTPAGGQSPFYHSHKKNEETYIFISGEGTFEVDETNIPIKPGTFVNVFPPGKRFIQNTSSVPMIFLCIQAQGKSLEGKTQDDGVFHK
jgi:mannose-6-phosphate isomerase-like protein (cupin superfamily)